MIGNKDKILKLINKSIYNGPVLNNSHRGDWVEMMVLDALGGNWKHVGLGWNLWDLQRGEGKSRVRIQVKQCAALQLWGKTKKLIISTPYSKRLPAYFKKDFPNEEIEKSGYFCEIFVIGIHPIDDGNICDQTDSSQWRFIVIPSSDLVNNVSSMAYSKAKNQWGEVSINELRKTVDKAILKIQ